jgi:hypothetical protein
MLIFLLFFFVQCADKGLESAYAKQDLILLMRKNQEKFTVSEAHLLLSGHVKAEEIEIILSTFTGKWSTSKCPSFNKSVLYSRLENDRNTELIQKIQSYGNQ